MLQLGRYLTWECTGVPGEYRATVIRRDIFSNGTIVVASRCEKGKVVRIDFNRHTLDNPDSLTRAARLFARSIGRTQRLLLDLVDDSLPRSRRRISRVVSNDDFNCKSDVSPQPCIWKSHVRTRLEAHWAGHERRFNRPRWVSSSIDVYMPDRLTHATYFALFPDPAYENATGVYQLNNYPVIPPPYDEASSGVEPVAFANPGITPSVEGIWDIADVNAFRTIAGDGSFGLDLVARTLRLSLHARAHVLVGSQASRSSSTTNQMPVLTRHWVAMVGLNSFDMRTVTLTHPSRFARSPETYECSDDGYRSVATQSSFDQLGPVYFKSAGGCSSAKFQNDAVSEVTIKTSVNTTCPAVEDAADGRLQTRIVPLLEDAVDGRGGPLCSVGSRGSAAVMPTAVVAMVMVAMIAVVLH